MLIRSLCLASLLAPLAQADIITVGPDPAVYDYTTIQPAVLFSAPGDTILIAPGEYAGFDVFNRSLQIIGAGPGRTRITELATMFSSGTSIRVHNQDQGRTRLGGFSIESPVDAGKWSGFPWLAVQNCSVPIELFDIEFEAPVATHWDTAFWTDDAFPSPRSGYVYASDCQQIFLSNVQINGAAERDFSELVMVGTSGGDTVGTAGLSAARSQIYAANCRFEGTRLPPCQAGLQPGAQILSGAGVRLYDTELIASNCSFVGGMGHGSADVGCTEVHSGPGAILKGDSQVFLHGGPQATVQGGAGFGSGPGAFGAHLFGPASFTSDPSVALAGGADSQGTPAATIESVGPEPVQVSTLLLRRPALIPSAGLALPGATVQLEMQGNPASVHAVLWDTNMYPAALLPDLQGEYFLGLNTAFILGYFPLDANGAATSSLLIPSQPEFLGVTVAMQSVELFAPAYFAGLPVIVGVGQ